MSVVKVDMLVVDGLDVVAVPSVRGTPTLDAEGVGTQCLDITFRPRVDLPLVSVQGVPIRIAIGSVLVKLAAMVATPVVRQVGATAVNVVIRTTNTGMDAPTAPRVATHELLLLATLAPRAVTTLIPRDVVAM